MPTCKVALRCTDPEGKTGQCEFYEATAPMRGDWGYDSDGWHFWDLRCKHIRTVEPLCTHPEARRVAFLAMVHEAMGIPRDIPARVAGFAVGDWVRVVADAMEGERWGQVIVGKAGYVDGLDAERGWVAVKDPFSLRHGSAWVRAEDVRPLPKEEVERIRAVERKVQQNLEEMYRTSKERRAREAMGIGVTDAAVPPPPAPPKSHLIRETDVREKSQSEHVFAAATFEEVVARAKQEALEAARAEERCTLCGQPPRSVMWAPYGDNRHLGPACECACGWDWWARARWSKGGG
jgi:hypothetical protein